MDKPAATRAAHVRELIEERIVTGEFPPGMRLDEKDLAARFAVSRTPLREALIQLASVGMVDMQPRRPTSVATVTPQRLVEMFEVMSEIEAMCGRLAARRMSTAEHMLLLNAHRACEQARDARDPDAYYDENERFHQLIYGGTHNAFLAEHASTLHRRLRPYRRLQLRVPGRIASSFAEHERIVQAIVAGDAALAARVLQEHVLIQGRRFNDLLELMQALRSGRAAPMAADAASAGLTADAMP